MKFDDLVKLVIEANEDQAGAPAPQAGGSQPMAMAKASAGQDQEQEGGKIYFCEVATKAIDNANAHKGKYPYMDRMIAQYAAGINKLKSAGVGKLNYSTLKKESIEGDTYEFVDALEFPNGEKIEHWPIALSVEIDDETIQKQLAQKWKKAMLKNVASKEAGGGEAGKEAEDIATALG